MTKDGTFGLKDGGLAAWNHFKTGQSSEFRRRFNSRPWDYKLEILKTWANETGWAAGSAFRPPPFNKDLIANGLFENHFLLGEKARFHDLVSTSDTFKQSDWDARKSAFPRPLKSWLSTGTLVEFDEDTIVKFEKNPAFDISVGLCPANTLCEIDGSVENTYGDMFKYLGKNTLAAGCNPLAGARGCKVNGADWSRGEQWGALLGVHDYYQCLGNCTERHGVSDIGDKCKESCLQQFERAHAKHATQAALDFLRRQK